MSQLDPVLVVKIIDKLEEKGDPYYPVSHLAHDLGEVENERDECACLTTTLVVHLLHLEDLGCVENMLRETSWGYQPASEGLEIQHGKDWETPHCYLGDSAASAIRLTANARQLREVLNDDTLGAKAKQYILSVGGSVVSTVLKQLALSHLPGN
ncbi:MAG: hypothetical protein RIB69_14865 [Roseovarius sp.]